MQVDQHAALRTEGHRVHGEVAPREVRAEIAGELDVLRVTGIRVAPLAAERRALEAQVVHQHQHRAVREPGGLDALEARHDLDRGEVGGDVVDWLPGSALEQDIAHGAADEVGLVPGLAQPRERAAEGFRPGVRLERRAPGVGGRSRLVRARPRAASPCREPVHRGGDGAAPRERSTMRRHRCRSWILFTAFLLLPTAAPAGAAGAAKPSPGQVRAWLCGLVRPDRLEHASLAFTAGLAAGVLTREPSAAVGGALVLGLGKELWDRHRSGFDPGDLAADAVGAVLAGVATRALER